VYTKKVVHKINIRWVLPPNQLTPTHLIKIVDITLRLLRSNLFLFYSITPTDFNWGGTIAYLY